MLFACNHLFQQKCVMFSEEFMFKNIRLIMIKIMLISGKLTNSLQKLRTGMSDIRKSKKKQIVFYICGLNSKT